MRPREEVIMVDEVREVGTGGVSAENRVRKTGRLWIRKVKTRAAAVWVEMKAFLITLGLSSLSSECLLNCVVCNQKRTTA